MLTDTKHFFFFVFSFIFLSTGVLQTYHIIVRGYDANMNRSRILTNVTIDATAPTLLLANLTEGVTYTVSVAAANRAGYGPYSAPATLRLDPITKRLDQSTLSHRYVQYTRHKHPANPYKINKISTNTRTHKTCWYVKVRSVSGLNYYVIRSSALWGFYFDFASNGSYKTHIAFTAFHHKRCRFLTSVFFHRYFCHDSIFVSFDIRWTSFRIFTIHWNVISHLESNNSFGFSLSRSLPCSLCFSSFFAPVLLSCVTERGGAHMPIDEPTHFPRNISKYSHILSLIRTNKPMKWTQYVLVISALKYFIVNLTITFIAFCLT